MESPSQLSIEGEREGSPSSVKSQTRVNFEVSVLKNDRKG
jgi:hypothetical protein